VKKYAIRKFAKPWMEQCAAVQYIRDGFGVNKAADYIVGEKLVGFIEFLDSYPDLRSDLPQFVAEIRILFSPQELHQYFTDERQRRGGTHKRRALLREAQALIFPVGR
jgi:hypothetical protein